MAQIIFPKSFTCCKRFHTCLLTIIGLLVTTVVLSTLKLLHLLQEDSEVHRHVYRDIMVDGWSSRENTQKTPPPHLPILLWWTPFTKDPGTVRTCGNYSCFFSNNRRLWNHTQTKVILFYGSDFSPTNLPLPRSSQEWALLHEESPKNNLLFSFTEIMTLFNHTSTFRRTSDFPLTLQYLESLDVLTDHTYYVPLSKKNELLARLAPVVYIQSDCDTPSQRDQYVQELMRYVPIDSYGVCLHNKDLPDSLQNPLETMNSEEFWRIVAQYKFTVAFENAVCDDYITEKLWRPLIVGSVPIYMGSPSVQDWLPNHNKSAIIASSFSSPQELAHYIYYLNENDDEYIRYLKHKLPGEKENVANAKLRKSLAERLWGINNDFEKGNFIEHFECFVCERLSANMERIAKGEPMHFYTATEEHYGCPAPYSNLDENAEGNANWWVEQWKTAKFEAMALRKLINEDRNYTAEEYYSLLLSMLQED